MHSLNLIMHMLIMYVVKYINRFTFMVKLFDIR